MVAIKLYGRATSKYNYLKMKILDTSQRADIKMKIEEVNSIETIVKDKIESIPAIKKEGDEKILYDHRGDLNQFIQEVKISLFKGENFGKMLKIIVPTDFSETSTNAFEYAKAFALKFNGVIQFVHFYHPKSIEFEGTLLTDLETEEIRRKQFDEYVDYVSTSWIGEKSEVLIDRNFILGFSGDRINDLVVDDNSIIVVGSTGSGGSIKKIFGSTSTIIAKNAKCPVIVVPPKTQYQPIHKIAYAGDKPNLDVKSIPHIKRIAHEFNSKIYLIHVAEKPDGYPGFDLLNEWKLNYPKSKIIVNNIENTDIQQGVNDFVEETNIDLLVMVKGDRSFFGELFHRSLTRKMAINTKIPLLILDN